MDALSLLRTLLVGMVLLSALPGWADTHVDPATQAARDDERLRILRDELAGEAQKAAAAVQRRAERLAVHDDEGVREAEQAHAATTVNIAALQRELGQASSRRAAVPAPPRPAVAWWDVYAKPAALSP